jgi:Mg-chelatase subunit ChlD
MIATPVRYSLGQENGAINSLPMQTIAPYASARTTAPWGRAPRAGKAAVAALLLLAASAGPIARADDVSEAPSLEIEYPADGLVLGPSECGLFVAGRAGPPKLDVVIVIDTSVSTAAASGADVDGDRRVGRSEFGRIGFTMGDRSTDPGDSILSAEIAAAQRLARALDPRRTRLGLVSFSGGPADLVRGEPVLPNALTRVPLTDDLAHLEEGLEILRRGTPAGGTHMAAGVDRATIELLGLPGAVSSAAPSRRRAAVLLTDGTPTQPFGPERPADNARAALRAADRARRARIRVSTVAIGPLALEGPVAAVEIAERTGGAFIPVRNTADLLEAIGEVRIAAPVRVELANRSSGEKARAFRMTPGGSWGGFVPLAPGDNRIEVVARAETGMEVRRTLTATLDATAPAAAIPREYDFLGSGAFGGCLRNVKRVELSAEELQRQQVRRKLLLEMERERAKAREETGATRDGCHPRVLLLAAKGARGRSATYTA